MSEAVIEDNGTSVHEIVKLDNQTLICSGESRVFFSYFSALDFVVPAQLHF